MDSERIKELEDENKELTEKNLYLQKTCEELKGIIRTAASTSERAVSEQLKLRVQEPVQHIRIWLVSYCVKIIQYSLNH